MRRFVVAGSLACLLLSSLVQAAAPDRGWPWFRGPDRNAVSEETGLLQAWDQGGPPLVLEIKGAGRGHASLAIVAGRIYTLGDGLSTAEDKDEYLSCFDQKTGEQLWKTKTGPAWKPHSADGWNSSSCTPAVDGDRVYAVTPFGVLVCCDAKSGAEKWRKSFEKDFEGKMGDGWGYSESVLIDGDRLICTPGREKNTMVALDKATGEKIWNASREGDKGAGHASVVISKPGGVKVYVTATASGGLGVRASDGKVLWSKKYETTAVIPTPIVRDDLVFFTAGYGTGGALEQQIVSGDNVELKEIYNFKPELGSKHGGVVLVGDYLYGGQEDGNVLFCAELKTGKVKWKERGAGGGSASTVAADGCLYVVFANGTVELVKADPSKYQRLGSFEIGKKARECWAHPVVLDGKLYVRDDDRILCYNVQAK